MDLKVIPGTGPTEDPSSVCRKLRTKTAFGTYTSTGDDWRLGTSTTAAYWCLESMTTAGPDDLLAHPHACQAGRSCYRAPFE
jgi:hypothetical protein